MSGEVFSRIVSRRTFGKVAAAAFLIASTHTLQQDRDIHSNIHSGLADFTQYRSEFAHSQRRSTRKPINGTIINTGLLLNDPHPDIQYVVDNVLALGGRYIRTFPPTGVEALEPEVGIFNSRAAKKILETITSIYQQSEGKVEIIFPMYDCFPLQSSDDPNPVYMDVPVNDPYLFGAQSPQQILENQLKFYTDPQTQHLFGNRLEFITQLLSGVPGVAGLEIANEPKIPVETSDVVGDLTAWHAECIKRVRNVDDTIPIIGGWATPWMVNSDQLDTDYDSAHAYDLWGTFIPRLNEYVNNPANKEVLVTELGFPGQFNGRLTPRLLRGFKFGQKQYDYLLSSAFANFIKNTSDIDRKQKKLRLKVGGVGFWQLKTTRESEDGFHYSQENNPLAFQTIRDYSTIASQALLS